MDSNELMKRCMEDETWEKVEEDFKKMMEGIGEEEKFGKVRKECQKLFDALSRCHESEGNLVIRCVELNAEVVEGEGRMGVMEEDSNRDQDTINKLRENIEAASSRLQENSRVEEEQGRQIEAHREEVTHLRGLIETQINEDPENERMLAEWMMKESELKGEKEELLSHVDSLKVELDHHQETGKNLEGVVDGLRKRILELEEEVQTKSNEAQKEVRRREKMEREVKQMQEDMKHKSHENQSLLEMTHHLNNNVSKAEKEKSDLKFLLDKNSKEKDQLELKIQKAETGLAAQTAHNETLTNQLATKNSLLKQKEEEVVELRVEVQHLSRLRETVVRKLKVVEDQRSELEKMKETLKTQGSSVEKDLDNLKRLVEQEKREKDVLTRERDSANQSLHRALESGKKHDDVLKVLEGTKGAVEGELVVLKGEVAKQQKTIIQLEKERDKFINESSQMTLKMLEVMGGLKTKERELYDWKKQVCTAESKLKQQEQLYEAVRADRNTLNKQLAEKQDEIADMRKKLKKVLVQSEQLKDQVTNQSNELNLEHAHFTKLEKEREQLKGELSMVAMQLSDNKMTIGEREAKEGVLMKEVAVLKAAMEKEGRRLNETIKQRETMEAQLTKKDKELRLLYEKIDLQESTLRKGEGYLKTRDEDVELLRGEVRRMGREKEFIEKKVVSMEQMSTELFRQEKKLVRERMKVKAMEEELENPVNVHRWRALETTDPSAYELVQKVGALQRRMMKKASEAVEKEVEMQEKEKMYGEMKVVLSRQFNHELTEQISSLKASLELKNKQFKAVLSELQMNRGALREQESDMEELRQQCREVNAKYMGLKKKHFVSTQEKLKLPHLDNYHERTHSSDVCC